MQPLCHSEVHRGIQKTQIHPYSNNTFVIPRYPRDPVLIAFTKFRKYSSFREINRVDSFPYILFNKHTSVIPRSSEESSNI